MTRHTAEFVVALLTGRAHRPPSHSAPATMATRLKRSLSSDCVAAGSKRIMLHQIPDEHLLSDIYTYWPANPAFDP